MKTRDFVIFLAFVISIQITDAQSMERQKMNWKSVTSVSNDSIDFNLIGLWTLSSQTWTEVRIDGKDTTKITSQLMGCVNSTVIINNDYTLEIIYPSSEIEKFKWKTSGNELFIINFHKIKSSIFSDSIFTISLFEDEGSQKLELTNRLTYRRLTLFRKTDK